MMPKIRVWPCVVLLAFASATMHSQAADGHADVAKELLVFLKAKERMVVAIKQIVALQVERDPRLGSFQPQIEAFVSKHMAWDELEPEIVDQYKKAFTEAELREILAFYTSEPGRKALANMERIIRQVGQSRNTIMRENSGDLRNLIEAAQRNQAATTPMPHS